MKSDCVDRVCYCADCLPRPSVLPPPGVGRRLLVGTATATSLRAAGLVVRASSISESPARWRRHSANVVALESRGAVVRSMRP